MFGLQSGIPSASSWIIDTFCLPHRCWKLHAWSLCFHCLSFPILAPSLCTQLYTLQSYWTPFCSLKAPWSLSLPFPTFAHKILLPGILFTPLCHCHPLLDPLGQLITYLLGVILNYYYYYYFLEWARGLLHRHMGVHKFFFKFYLFSYIFMAVLGLRFCARAFSSCGKWGPLFIAVRGPVTIAASLVAEHRLQTRKLSNCGSRA